VTRRWLVGRMVVAVAVAAPSWRGVQVCVGEPTPVGEVRGTARGSGPRAGSPPVPFTDLALVLLPQSAALVEGLERVRRQSRNSMAAYRSAIPDMRRLVEGAMQELRTAGRGDAIRGSRVNGDGQFLLEGVPRGDWVLIGYRSVYIDRASKDTAKESGTFLSQPRLVGYHRVAVWIETVTVEAARREVVELTDRNVWFEGVEEKTAARERTPSTGGGRRSAR
jgi:hypothetical protein